MKINLTSLLFLIGIFFFAGCNLNKSKLESIMRPKTLESEVIPKSDINLSDCTESFFYGDEISPYSMYSRNDGDTWGVLYNKKPITADVYTDINLLGDFVCITRKVVVSTENTKGYGAQEETEKWIAVINNQSKVIVPFGTNYDVDYMTVVLINNKKYIMITSGWDTIYYDTESGDKYFPTEEEILGQTNSTEAEADEYSSWGETDENMDSIDPPMTDSIY